MRRLTVTLALAALGGIGALSAYTASAQLGTAVSPVVEPAQSAIIASTRSEQPATCPSEGPSLQVLGSGGPIAENGRAGTSYLLRIDGKPRMLIDAGSGSFLRYSEAGAKLSDLDAILLTHLHADHVGDLPGILKSGGFENRTKPLTLIGPDGAPRFPATSEFVDRLFGKESGSFAYLGGYADGTEGKPQLVVRDIVTNGGEGESVEIGIADAYSITAIPVHHGVVPALGYWIEVGNSAVAITGDQSFLSEKFANSTANKRPDIIFAHHVIPEGDGQPRGLHRQPGSIGELAAGSQAKRLVLTHNMNRSLVDLENGLAAIGAHYPGPVTVADDMDCYAF